MEPLLLFLPFVVLEDERDGGTLRLVGDSVDLDLFCNLGGLTLSVGLLVDLLFVLVEPEGGLLYPGLFESFSLNVNCLPLLEAGDGFILTGPFLFPLD